MCLGDLGLSLSSGPAAEKAPVSSLGGVCGVIKLGIFHW